MILSNMQIKAEAVKVAVEGTIKEVKEAPERTCSQVEIAETVCEFREDSPGYSIELASKGRRSENNGGRDWSPGAGIADIGQSPS